MGVPCLPSLSLEFSLAASLLACDADYLPPPHTHTHTYNAHRQASKAGTRPLAHFFSDRGVGKTAAGPSSLLGNHVACLLSLAGRMSCRPQVVYPWLGHTCTHTVHLKTSPLNTLHAGHARRETLHSK